MAVYDNYRVGFALIWRQSVSVFATCMTVYSDRPRNQARDGGFRSVRVEVARPGMQVASRVGYYAPK